MPSELDMAIDWIAHNVIANEDTRDPLPILIQERLARRLVEDPLLGWPDVESARLYLQQTFRWAPTSMPR